MTNSTSKSTPSFGIMQGRLSPPENGRFQSFPSHSWRREFPLATEAGIDYIEWIYDDYGASANPLSNDTGISEINRLRQQSGIAIPAICADWFMDFPLHRCDGEERSRRQLFLKELLNKAKRIDVKRVVLPFVDASKIETKDDMELVLAVLEDALPTMEATGVELHLEADFGPADFAAFLTRIPHPMIKVNYDSGNSSGLGYIASEEFAAYGDRIGSIHIKDRLRNSDGSVTTMPPGEGSANFDDLFRSIRSINYAGGLTLQIARGESGDEIAWNKKAIAFLRNYWP